MAKGEPSFTVTLVTLNKRSSFGKSAAFAAGTTLVVGDITVCAVNGVLEVAAVTPSIDAVAANIVPVPSSLIVAVPVAVCPLADSILNLNVSLLSIALSLTIGVRTNNTPAASILMSPAE